MACCRSCGRHVTYDPATGKYALPEVHAIALTDGNSTAYVVGACQFIAGLFKDEDKFINAFRTGKGLTVLTIMLLCAASR